MGVTPASVQLPTTIPVGCKAYRRRVLTLSTNIQTAGPSDTAFIYPSTATSSTFLDTATSALQFDIQFYNGWFAADYVNFGAAGVGGAVIQELCVYSQSLPLEQMMEYPTLATCMANISPMPVDITTFYYTSRLKKGVDNFNPSNFIKPPMVTEDGNIMFGFNQFGLGFDTGLVNGTQYTNAMSTNAANGLGAYNLKCQDGDIDGRVGAGVVGIMEAVGNNSGAYSNQLISTNDADPDNTTLRADMIGMQPFLNARNVSALPSWITSGVGSAPSQLLGGATPMDWPDYFDPKMVKVETQFIKSFGSATNADITLNLANVKCFPIGMIPPGDCYGSGQSYGTASTSYAGATVTANTSSQAARQPTAYNPKFRVVYRFLSGLLGMGAAKMFPTCLAAPNSLQISIKFADPWTAFQITSDPLRRIMFTIRDYIRNLGTANGQFYGLETHNPSSNCGDIYNYEKSAFAPGYSPYHSVPIQVGTTQTTSFVNSIFSMGAAGGRSEYQSAIGTQAAIPDAVLAFQNGGVAPWGSMVHHKATPPQYALASTPWLFHFLTSASNQVPVKYCNETDMFYGSNQEGSVPQTRRIFDHNYDGSVNPGSVPPNGTADTTNTGITYRITNLGLVADYITFPAELANMLVEQAAAGMYNIHTTTVTTAAFQVQNSISQTINLSLKVAAAKKLFLIFQDLEARAPSTGFYYDSNCSFNIFSQLDVGLGNTAANIPVNTTTSTDPCGRITGGGTGIVYGVGVTNRPLYTPTPTDNSNGFSAQLQFGDDFIPPAPLTTMAEIIAELAKTLEMPVLNANCPIAPFSSSGQNFKSCYNCLIPNKFQTTFVPYELLDDQTIMCNYDQAPLFCYSAVLNANPPASASTATGGTQAAAATRNSAMNGYNYLCPRGFCTNLFVSPSSTFMLGFNFSVWKAKDGIQSSTFLGNNTLTCKLENAIGLTGTTLSGSLRNYRGIAVVKQEGVLRIGEGGSFIFVK